MTREELKEEFLSANTAEYILSLSENEFIDKYTEWLEDKCIEQSKTIEIFRQAIIANRKNKARF